MRTYNMCIIYYATPVVNIIIGFNRVDYTVVSRIKYLFYIILLAGKRNYNDNIFRGIKCHLRGCRHYISIYYACAHVLQYESTRAPDND